MTRFYKGGFKMKNILIPIDCNSGETTTIDEAVQIAKKFDSKITLLNIDNTKKELGRIDNRRFIDDGRMVTPLGNRSFLDENNLPKAASKNNVEYYEKEDLRNRY